MSATHPEFEDILEGRPEPVRAIARILRNKILSLDSDIAEAFIGGPKPIGSSYSLGSADKVIAVIQPEADHCTFYIHHADAIDAGELKLEGAKGHAHYIKLHDPDELPRAELKRVLHDVIHIVKS